MRDYEGGCHCRAVRFQVTADLSTAEVCNCSICTMKGFVHLIVPRERFQLLQGEDALTTYRFNTGVAQHRFCTRCGVHPFYAPRSDPDKIDVNVRCLDGVDLDALRPRPFDGRNWEQAMAVRGRVEESPEDGERTCGQELAADAEVPAALAVLMRHVAENMDRHATWVGTDPEAGAPRKRGARRRGRPLPRHRRRRGRSRGRHDGDARPAAGGTRPRASRSRNARRLDARQDRPAARVRRPHSPSRRRFGGGACRHRIGRRLNPRAHGEVAIA